MKLFKKAKKGFTLIELVVVIAVIAILSAVSIVSYVAITNRAKESNDHMVIDQVNTALTGSSILNKKATVHEIVDSLVKEEGFDVRQIKPELKDARFVYLYEENTFGYWKNNKVVYPKSIEGKGAEAGNDIWFFEDKAENYNDDFSHYLNLEQVAAGFEISVKGGFDAGACEGVSVVNFARSSKAVKDVLIRTNNKGTTLNVNAPQDTVKHYGQAGLIDIISTASTSYHEHGDVSLAKIANGRFVVTEEAKMETLHAVATNDQFNDITLAVVGNAEVPAITRDKVSIDDKSEEGVYSQYVLEVQTLARESDQEDHSEYVWISVAVDGSGNVEKSTDVATSKTELSETTKIPASSQSAAAAAIAEDATTTMKFYDVSSESELTTALGSSDDNIMINVRDDFEIANIAFFSRSTTINGLGHEIKGKANRVFRVTAPNLDIKVTDLAITSICTDTSDVRGISFDNASAGSSLLLDRCSISASFYVINAVLGADNLKITIKNGTVAAGWAAINMYSNNSTVNVENSTLRGLNDKGESAWNSFNTITLDGGCLTKGKANVGTAGSNNKINISKSTIYASSKSENKQFWVGLQYGAIGNQIVVDSETKIIDAFDEDMTGVLNIGYYCNYRKTAPYWDYYANNSTIKVGDETISLVTEFDGDGNLIDAHYQVE